MENRVDENLIAKYYEGRCTPEEAALVEKWLWDDYQQTTGKMPEAVAASLRDKLKEEMGRVAPVRPMRPNEGSVPRVMPMRRRRYYMIAAAAILLVVMAGALLLRRGHSAANGGTPEIVYNDSIYNKSDRPYKALLADGSTVWLNAGSVLYLATDFNKTERRVKISGEAFFEIKQDKVRPFYTEAGKLTTQVLGTAYDIEAWPTEKEIRVSLLQGKVAVRSAGSSYTLSPGQAVAYVKQTGHMQVQAPSIADPTGWKNGTIVLNRIALPEALDRLSRLYHTVLTYDPQQISEKYITGEFQRDSLPLVLKSILFVHNLKYKPTADGGYQIY